MLLSQKPLKKPYAQSNCAVQSIQILEKNMIINIHYDKQSIVEQRKIKQLLPIYNSQHYLNLLHSNLLILINILFENVFLPFVTAIAIRPRITKNSMITLIYKALGALS